ncbi:MAG TPA: acyl-CoA synthetase [Rhizomicrobium sp.]|jgi:fatty-acyl-CoA synthase|nr:acyl-CoA synthetase [Rhizomicrobium sp.]
MAKSLKRGKKKAKAAKRARPAKRRVAQKAVKKSARTKTEKPVPAKPAQRLPPSRVRPRRRPSATLTPRLRSSSAYDQLPRTGANFQPLTPLSMLERAAGVFPDHLAVIHGKQRFTYAEFYRRSRRLASVLAAHGIGKNDTVAAMLANTPAMLEAHYGVPMTGGVLNALNTRLDAPSIAYMLEHGDAKILITDREFSTTIAEALKLLKRKPLVIDYDDPEFPQDGEPLGEDYEAFLQSGDPDFAWKMPGDEWDAISLNYTSGTTGRPKGVVYHHRGASLMGFSNVLAGNIGRHPVLLWTLPMFHCNGWCFPWTLSVVAGTHICLRWVRAGAIYQAIAEHGITHLCGAPIVMSTIINAREDEKRAFNQRVTFMVAAAPPPEAVLAGMDKAGFDIVHVYGLTEVYGPAVVNEWHQDWDTLKGDARAKRQARQGVRYHTLEELNVLDPETMEPKAPGELGEVMFRGNVVMKGYLKNPDATRQVFAGGWFHSGDLGVMDEDGYIQLKDRSKDIIISGGENISSIEIENVLTRHPAVMFAAVVAKPDEKWGETPCAFVEKRSGHDAVTEEEILAFCREQLAKFKAPRFLVFAELPKTSTGKVQKFALRERARIL